MWIRMECGVVGKKEKTTWCGWWWSGSSFEGTFSLRVVVHVLAIE